MGIEACSMAFAVVGKEYSTIGGKVTGFASSAKAELMGLTADQNIYIRLDNQSVVTQFDKIVTHRMSSNARDRLRHNNYMDWAVLSTICAERACTATVLWVAGHNGDDWNEKADKAAKATHRKEEQA